MNVLVTGGAGFIGSHTVDRLLEKGHSVRVLDSLAPPVHPQPVRPGYLADAADLIVGDVLNREDLREALDGIDVVFHLAARQDYLPDFSTFAFVNDGGTALLYETIVRQQLPVHKVILASSQSVYGEGRHRCPEHGPVYPPPRPLGQLENGDWEVRCPHCGESITHELTDESHTNPHNQYAVSKYCQELYALTLGHRYEIPTVVLRYSITQGPRQSFHNAYSGILRSFTLRLLGGQPPVIYEDGGQLRDYVYVGDVAQANLLVMESDAANYQVYNVGGGDAISVRDYAATTIDVFGEGSIPEIPGEFRFGDSRHTVSDSRRIEKLGWRRTLTLREVIREYLAWVADQPEIPRRSYAEAAAVMKEAQVIRPVKQLSASLGT
ncbi:MAG: NAD-dependent epimerase/dehydratase family protein [Dehalococcoidales bacterium]